MFAVLKICTSHLSCQVEYVDSMSTNVHIPSFDGETPSTIISDNA